MILVNMEKSGKVKMTCNKDCQRCFYGLRIPTYKCGNKNVTCDGECHKCPFRIEKSVSYVCGMSKKL